MFSQVADRVKLPTANLATNGGLVDESVNDTNNHDTTVFLDMANYHEAICVFIVETNSGTTDSLTCTALQGTTAAGGSAKACSGAGYANGTIPAGSDNYVVLVKVTTDMLDRTNGYQYIGCRCVASGSTDTLTVTMFILRVRPRWSDSTLPA